DDEQPRLPCVAAHVDERRPALAPLRLEEGRLRLDRDREGAYGVDDPATELDDAEPLRHECRIGIEPDAERRTLALHTGSGPVPERTRLGHAYQDTRRPRQSVPENEEAARRRPLDPRRRLGLPLVSRSPALDGRLESTAGRELRNGCCRDVH